MYIECGHPYTALHSLHNVIFELCGAVTVRVHLYIAPYSSWTTKRFTDSVRWLWFIKIPHFCFRINISTLNGVFISYMPQKYCVIWSQTTTKTLFYLVNANKNAFFASSSTGNLKSNYCSFLPPAKISIYSTHGCHFLKVLINFILKRLLDRNKSTDTR